MSIMIWTYGLYLVLCLAVTIWVAQTLSSHAPIFVARNESEPDQLARSLTQLITVGFYLVNIGIISLTLKYGQAAIDAVEALELLSTKVGGILVVLGFVHFVILAKLFNIRQRLNPPRGTTTPGQLDQAIREDAGQAY